MSEIHAAEAEAIAIRDGLILEVGSNASVIAIAGPETQVIDLNGRRVIPGLIDAHNHGVKACLATLFACKFPFSVTPHDLESALGDFMDRNPDVQFVMGGRYGSEFLKKYATELTPSPREWLDARSRGRAVYLREDSGHNGWANSKTLDFLGITRNSPNPKGGRFERNTATGELTGILIEDADVQARGAWPDWTPTQYYIAVLEFARIANSFGIIGGSDADANEGILRAFKQADDDGKLSLYIAAAQTTPYGHRDTQLDYTLHERWRDAYTSRHVDTRFIKIYLDGVARDDSRTAFLIEPYLPDPRFPSDHRAHAHVTPTALAHDYIELDRRGFTIKTHCCGDGSVRATLNAIQSAREANQLASEELVLRHEVAHCMLVSRTDIPRFRELNAVAELSPYLWSGESCVSHRRACLGDERIEIWYPVRELWDAGAALAAGSDWPAAVASLNPWLGLASFVTRTDPTEENSTPVGLDQALTLKEALHIFTVQVARALRRETVTGRIEVGMSADLAVLDRDIFRFAPEEVAFANVNMTFFEGRIVFQKE
ncbi:hypothetical protein HDU93_009009 [Gonapodya sp. JEL0774]|nr:hypothetical protein HDU93_009009 [Gonapodya sp. JEL0774]